MSSGASTEPERADTWTNQLPTPSLARPSFDQARVPGDRDRYAPAVAEFDDERVLGNLNVLDGRGFRCQT